jgi:hypothetical protein
MIAELNTGLGTKEVRTLDLKTIVQQTTMVLVMFVVKQMYQ